MAATTWTWISRLIRNLATREEEAVRLGVQLKKMPDRYSIATLTRPSSRVIQWFLHLGGLGLILLGLLDGFLLPIFPGSMDIATIFLAAHDKKLWFYYAAMATAGSVLGGLLTYRLARKGGKEAFERRFRGENVKRSIRGLSDGALPQLPYPRCYRLRYLFSPLWLPQVPLGIR
jgi:membrane protein YqaA with SNARE-associated domain